MVTVHNDHSQIFTLIVGEWCYQLTRSAYQIFDLIICVFYPYLLYSGNKHQQHDLKEFVLCGRLESFLSGMLTAFAPCIWVRLHLTGNKYLVVTHLLLKN